MPHPLPSDDEIRRSLRRGRPSAAVEYLGCVIVLACVAGGITAAVIVIEMLGGFDALNPGHVRP